MTQLSSGFTCEKVIASTGSHALSGEDTKQYHTDLTASFGSNITQASRSA
jgi:hypothetical protein